MAFQEKVLQIFLYIEAIFDHEKMLKHTHVSPEIHTNSRNGERSKAVRNFSANSTVLVALGFPYYLGSYYCESQRGDLNGGKIKLGDGEELGDNEDESG